MAAFTWGRGGARLTPEEIERQRLVAEHLMSQGADYSPVRHWTQGAARAMSGVSGGLAMRKADQAADANAAESEQMLASLTGGAPTRTEIPANAPPSATAPGDLVERVIQQESAGNPNAVSPKGAMGLMQVMPATARDPGFGVRPMDPAKAFDPEENRRFGTEYLTAMQNRYGGDTEAALVAYNAGPGRADQFVKTGRDRASLPKETQDYIAKIMGGGARKPTQTAQAGGVNPAVLKAMTSPYASPQVQAIAKMMMEQQLEQSTPKGLMEVNGRIYDPNTNSVVQDFSKQPEQPSAVREYEYAKGQGFPGTFQDWEASKKGGMSLQVDPITGQVTFQQGSNIKPMTEGQSKDTVYATRAEGALQSLETNADALLSPFESMAGSVPFGNYAKTPEYQQAEQAGKEFLQAILRKDTGAAITKEETGEYGTVYLPQPGDTPQVLTQKRVSRQRAVEALKAGMPPQAILAQEKALRETEAKTGRANKPLSEMTDEELEAIANGE